MQIKKVVIALLCLLFVLGGAGVLGAPANEPPVRKIVVFQPGFDDAAKDNLVGKFQGLKLKKLGIINGQAVMLSPKDARDLASQPGVLRVDDDVVVQAADSGQEIGQGQMVSWGIEKINAKSAWASGDTGAAVKVGIIDTGISNSHPDLIDNIKGGVNTIVASNGWNDDHGHGSHVAGIIAALDNSIGTVGVGPQINLYAIKVLNSSGSGNLSDIIEGIDWAVANKMQVINMSLSTASNIQSFRDACARAKNAGIVVVAAAGNSGGSVQYPGAYPEVIGVSAIDSTNTIASFSSRGTQVDLAAPGVSIYSTYKGVDYATLSGTSMASPHVAGAAALVLARNASLTPDQVQARLQSTAQDLGDTGFDSLYGWGLVDAYAASNFNASDDIVAPGVSLTAPANGAIYTTAQTVGITASASDNVGVTKVDFYDGAAILGTSTSSPYSYSWAIDSFNNGSHSLTARAYDAAGNSKVSGTVSVTVNISTDPVAPTVSLTSPADGETYTTAQTVNIAASADDNVGVSKVEFYDNGTRLGTATTSPYSYSWTISGSNNGSHSLTAKAYDAVGNSAGSDPVSVTINIPVPDTTVPSVSITAPASNSIINNTANITANASDNVGVTNVEFYVDNILLGADTSSPYSYAWDTTTATNGGHSLTAMAYDAAGNSNVSTAVAVNVNNSASGDITAPVASIAYPTATSVNGTVNIIAIATDNVGVNSVEFYVDNVLVSTDTAWPYEYAWNTKTATNAKHSLMVKAYDTSNNKGTSVTVAPTVANSASCLSLPVTSFISPADGAILTKGQTYTVKVNASDPDGIRRIYLYADSTNLGYSLSASVSKTWKVPVAAKSYYILRAHVDDNKYCGSDTVIEVGVK